MPVRRGFRRPSGNLTAFMIGAPADRAPKGGMVRREERPRAQTCAIARALRRSRRRASRAPGSLSGAINVLALTGPLYMLEIYNRVLPSRSVVGARRC